MPEGLWRNKANLICCSRAYNIMACVKIMLRICGEMEPTLWSRSRGDRRLTVEVEARLEHDRHTRQLVERLDQRRVALRRVVLDALEVVGRKSLLTSPAQGD